MITDKHKILVEWAYRTHNGKPNPKSMAHQIILEGVLKDFGWGIEERGVLLRNLQEAKPKKSAEDEKYFAIGYNSYILKSAKPKDWKKDDPLPSGIQKFTKDEDSGKYSPVEEKPETGKKKEKEKPKAGDITGDPSEFERDLGDDEEKPEEEPEDEPKDDKEKTKDKILKELSEIIRALKGS